MVVPTSCPSPARSGQGWPRRAGGHRGAPAEEAPGPEREGVPGPVGEGSGAESAEALPSRPSAPRRAGGSAEPGIVRCRRCQAQGRRHPQMAPVSGTLLGLSFHGEAPVKGVTVPPGTGTASGLAAPNPSCTPQLSPACGQHQAPAGRGAGKFGHRPGVGCQNPPEIVGSQEIPALAGAALSLRVVNRLPSPAAEMPKIFHPPRPCGPKVTRPAGSRVAEGVTAFRCREGWKSSTQRSFSLPSPQEGSASPASVSLLPSRREDPGSWEGVAGQIQPPLSRLHPAERDEILNCSQAGTGAERGAGQRRWAVAGVSRAGELPHAGGYESLTDAG